ncbi:hypothetical protein [Panacagrimonas sp.]|uniref:hypothetical protein n=1 Tax=Panacagrimonas sp. TaxID=2480088 RepID=UPI003B51CB4E
MHATRTQAVAAPTAADAGSGSPGRPAGRLLEDSVQQGLNLFLALKNPAQMPALLASLDALQPQVRAALSALHYVHFARFLPSRDGSTLMVITVFDGDLQSYLMDFVAVLGEVFTAILEFVRDAPRLPVSAYPQDFCEFVMKNNLRQVQPWAAYPSMTVLDILQAQSRG